MTSTGHDFQKDIDAIAGIDAVRTILDVVCRTTGMGFAAVARVTEDRWVACEILDQIDFGLKPGGELDVRTTICSEIRESGTPVVINNVAEDPAFCGHPTPAKYGFQSYISMPIVRKDGSFFGTLCAIDPRPARLKNDETIGMFKLFAELIAFHLDAQERVDWSEASLGSERRSSELREQFIAVIGHDLRNPLASIDAGTKMLARTPLDDKAKTILDLMRGSVSRMSGLIDNILDFARGRLGGGLPLNLVDQHVDPILEQVIEEYRAIWPDRRIETRLQPGVTISADSIRIGQLLGNLVGNALSHGHADGPVRIETYHVDGAFRLEVSNSGDEISVAARERMFQPFYRGEGSSGKGLGLGLYIASQIAAAHGGELTLQSDPEETRFIFQMPAGRDA